jgi:cytochrome b559 alpha subunit
MSGTTGERPFSDILTSIRYWVIHYDSFIIYCWVVIYQYRLRMTFFEWYYRVKLH